MPLGVRIGFAGRVRKESYPLPFKGRVSVELV